MAHVVVITAKMATSGCEITITETGASSTSEVELTIALLGKPLPVKGRIVRVISKRSAGTGTTIQPTIGTVTNPSGTTIRYEATATAVATTIDDQPTAPPTYRLVGSSLFHRLRPDAGADNDAVTVYHILPGWGE